MKKLSIISLILLSVILITLIAYIKLTTNITLNSGNFYSVRVTGFGSIGLKNTDDKPKMNKVIIYLKSIRCYKTTERLVHSQSPDATVFFTDANGKIADRLDFYGDLVEHSGNQYRVVPFMYYSGLEKLCMTLNDGL